MKAKERIAKLYTKALKNVPQVRVLESAPSSTPNQHLFVIAVPKRDKLQEYLQKNGIPTLIHYPLPIHLVKAFGRINKKKGDFPMAENLSKHILSLPFHPFLKKKDIATIAGHIHTFYR
jgi:dTDP-4-amino-4,6-dideoxygalactose transaminase